MLLRELPRGEAWAMIDRRVSYPLLALVWSLFGLSAAQDRKRAMRRRFPLTPTWR